MKIPKTNGMMRAAILILCLAPELIAADWPQWRGPTGDGICTDAPLPTHWAADSNVVWKTPLPGTGHSSPIVVGNRIFVTACREEKLQRVLLCLDRLTGKILWERVVLTAPLERKHLLNSYASSTPATDGHLVWVSFLAEPLMQIACYDIDGNKKWQTSPGEFHSVHGYCSPPIPFGNTIILNGDQDADAWLVALDKLTGKEIWRTDRPNKTRSYCPPIIIEAAGKMQLVLSGSKCVASYDPKNGKQHWIVDGPTEQFVASPVFADGVVFVTGGFPTYHLIGINPAGTGNVTKTHVLWHHQKQAAYVPSPIAWEHHFYVVTDQGRLFCLDTLSGKINYQERLGTHHSASPIAAAGFIYFPDDDGNTFVVTAGPKFELVAKNVLDEPVFASPAASAGQIFIRTAKHLWCVGNATAQTAKSHLSGLRKLDRP